MRLRIYALVLIGVGAVVPLATPALAHHAFTEEFDSDKKFSVTGVLTRVDWVNPHTYYYLDVKEGGNVVEWDIESLPPGMLHKAGASKDMFKVGEVVTVDVYAAKDGSKHLAFARTFRFADGPTIEVMNDAIQAPGK